MPKSGRIEAVTTEDPPPSEDLPNFTGHIAPNSDDSNNKTQTWQLEEQIRIDDANPSCPPSMQRR